MTTLPTSFLLRFFEVVKDDLKDCNIDSPAQSLNAVREQLLLRQRVCLDRVVAEHNSGDPLAPLTSVQVQGELKQLVHLLEGNSELGNGMEEMNESVRVAFARLVLRSEHLWSNVSDDRALIRTGAIKRADLLEFVGLCRAVMKNPGVLRHLQDGTPIFANGEDSELQPEADQDKKKSAFVLPQKRLEDIQRSMMRAVGYDPDHGTAEIKRIFFTCNKNEYSNDKEVFSNFNQMAQAIHAALTEVTSRACKAAFSDQNEGGVTRVVAVNFSEKTINEKGEETIAGGGGGSHQRMEQQTEAEERSQLKMAQKAAALQQEILGELLSMEEEERDDMLQRSAEASTDCMNRAMELPAGPERITYFRSIDTKTQRLMAMHKLWNGMLAANGGKPPQIRSRRPHHLDT